MPSQHRFRQSSKLDTETDEFNNLTLKVQPKNVSFCLFQSGAERGGNGSVYSEENKRKINNPKKKIPLIQLFHYTTQEVHLKSSENQRGRFKINMPTGEC